MEQSTLQEEEVFILSDDTLTVTTPDSYNHALYVKEWYARNKKRLGLFVLDPEVIDEYGNETVDHLSPHTTYQVCLYTFPEQFTKKHVLELVQKEKLLFVGIQGLCLLWEKRYLHSLYVMKKKRKKRIMALSSKTGAFGAETVISLEKGFLFGRWQFREYYITEGRDHEDDPCTFDLVSLMGNLQKKTVFIFFKEL